MDLLVSHRDGILIESGQRDLYPASIFRKHRKFNMPLQMSIQVSSSAIVFYKYCFSNWFWNRRSLFIDGGDYKCAMNDLLSMDSPGWMNTSRRRWLEWGKYWAGKWILTYPSVCFGSCSLHYDLPLSIWNEPNFLLFHSAQCRSVRTVTVDQHYSITVIELIQLNSIRFTQPVGLRVNGFLAGRLLKLLTWWLE